MNNSELAIVKEDSREVGHMRNARLDDSLFSKELAPHYMQLASKLASSDLVPKSYRGKPQDLFICWAMGYQIGVSPEQAMQCIAVINGRPAMWGDDMLALCMAHKDFEDIIEEGMLNNDGMVIGYTCTVKRKGMSPKKNIFTLYMAKKAGLLAKGGVWSQYPERMLKLRARGFSLRDAFPDALKGIKPREEVEDYIDADYKVVDDKVSRTQFLKNDMLNRKENTNDKNDSDNVSEASSISNKAQADRHNGFESMGSASGEENGQVAENSGIEETQDDYIRRLVEEKGFDKERQKKAFEYYEVENIESMSSEVKANFIKQLEKA